MFLGALYPVCDVVGSRASVPRSKRRSVVCASKVARETPRQSIEPDIGVARLGLLSKPEFIATVAVYRACGVLVRRFAALCAVRIAPAFTSGRQPGRNMASTCERLTQDRSALEAHPISTLRICRAARCPGLNSASSIAERAESGYSGSSFVVAPPPLKAPTPSKVRFFARLSIVYT